MKNVLIVALVIGLAVSLWFNWKGFVHPRNDAKFRSIELGRDSLVVDYYYEKLAVSRSADSLESNMPQIKGQTTPNDKNPRKPTLYMSSEVIETSKGCEDCNYEEKGKTEECVNISCMPPVDINKFQVIVHGPAYAPGPDYRLVAKNIHLKYRLAL